jgi:hypothetical protein
VSSFFDDEESRERYAQALRAEQAALRGEQPKQEPDLVQGGMVVAASLANEFIRMAIGKRALRILGVDLSWKEVMALTTFLRFAGVCLEEGRRNDDDFRKKMQEHMVDAGFKVKSV